MKMQVWELMEKLSKCRSGAEVHVFTPDTGTEQDNCRGVKRVDWDNDAFMLFATEPAPDGD